MIGLPRVGARAALAALALALGAGCPGRIEDPIAFREEAARRCPTNYDVERDLFARTCATLGCHTGGAALAAAGLDLQTAGIAERLRSHVSASMQCGGRAAIVAGDTESSLLWQKVGEPPPCGDRMPSAQPPLNPTELACLRQYVAALAGDASDGGAPPPPPPPPPDAGMTPTAVTIEAEEMTLSGYVVDPLDAALIRLPEGVPSGTATASFTGVAGSYRLWVFVVAESDGQPRLTIRVAGAEVAAQTYPLALTDMEPETLGPFTVTLAPGDAIELTGEADAGAWARVDRLEIRP
ncbi:MAG: hypothetical protein KF729_31835 [Sandaracinaceae bacterium]|nr:hypothetical protein [Sandaracinaceae bacterium]